MKLIVYSRGCLTCRYRGTLSALQLFRLENGMGIEFRRIDLSALHRAEAERIYGKVPFVYSEKTNKAVQLTDKEHWADLV